MKIPEKISPHSREAMRPHKAPSQKIGRELEASKALLLCPARTRNEVRVPAANYTYRAWLPNANREPENSEGAASQKIVPGLEASSYRLQRVART